MHPDTESEQPRGRAKKITRVLFTCLLYALVAVLVVTFAWLLIDKYVKKSPAPGAFGYAPLIVVTGSMSDAIEAGDMVIIHSRKEYAVGDIVTFMPPGATVPTTHRIVSVNEDGTFATRGDANNTDDKAPVSKDMILGEVVKVIPNVGSFVKWLKEANGWIYIAIIGALVILGIFVFCRKDS